MKNLIGILIIVFAFSSCSDDDNNPVNPPVNDTLYTFDSLGVYTPPGVIQANLNTISFGSSTQFTMVRVEFRLQSNVDSTHGSFASYRDSTNGTPMPPSPQTVYLYSPIDTAYSKIYNVSGQFFFAGFDIGVYTTRADSVGRYIYMKNIKIIKAQ